MKHLASLWYPKLRLSKFSTADFTHADVYAIEMFQYFRHTLIVQFGNIFSASEKIPA